MIRPCSTTMKLFNLFCFLSVLVTSRIECAKILGIFHYPSKSHHILARALLKALAAKGHQVTFLSPHPPETPTDSYKDVDLPGILSYFTNNNLMEMITKNGNSSFNESFILDGDLTRNITNLVFEHDKMRHLTKLKKRFKNFEDFFLSFDGANILKIFYLLSNTHQNLDKDLLKMLTKRKLQVPKTSLTNYKQIQLANTLQLLEESALKHAMQFVNISLTKKLPILNALIKKIDNWFFTNPSLKSLLTSNQIFNLVIQVWSGNEAYLSIPHHFGAATIAFSTFGGSYISSYVTGNPDPYSYVPYTLTSFSNDMNFIQRVTNTLLHIGANVFMTIFSNEETNRQKYFPNAPPTYKMVKNVSFVFLNTHYDIEGPRPYVPTMIQIGGLHIDEPKPLKEDLKQFMDSESKGVIFFSLGSNLKCSDLPEHKLEAIIKCFSKLQLKILWKCENETIKNLPPNVKIAKWLPQRDILAHRNIKLFISHGGLLSTTEAVYSGVPIVGIPVFVDQNTNTEQSVTKGYALKVPLQELSEETFTKAIKEILNNPKYRDNIKKRSSIVRDQPMKPIDKAVFWIEYLLRHNGAHHLKTNALKLEWYQYFLLDVIAFILVLLILAFGIIYYAVLFIAECAQLLVFRT